MFRAAIRQLVLMTVLASGLAGCASPLFADDDASVPGTVPRDEMGEPIWSKIQPAQNGNAPQ